MVVDIVYASYCYYRGSVPFSFKYYHSDHPMLRVGTCWSLLRKTLAIGDVVSLS